MTESVRAVDRIRWFDALPRATAVAALMTVCHSHRWAEAVADGRPYRDLETVQDAADEIWQHLDPADWREALDGHPRIGEQGGASAEFSRQEQAGMSGAADDVRAAIAAGNRGYEDRFGHVFLISAAGRDSHGDPGGARAPPAQPARRGTAGGGRGAPPDHPDEAGRPARLTALWPSPRLSSGVRISS